MSSGPRIAVGTGINGMGVILKAGYPKGSGGAAPLSHAGMCSRERSVYRLSLLNSRRTRRGMPLTDQLEHRGGLFIDSNSTLCFGDSGSGSRELLEDSSSSAAALLSFDRISSLPLFCLAGGGGWPLPHKFSARSPSR